MIRDVEEVLKESVDRSAFSISDIAVMIGVRHTYLHNQLNTDLEKFRFPLGKLLPVLRIIKDYSVLDVMEHSVGRVAFKLPEVTGNIDDIRVELCKTMKEFGDMTGAAGAAFADNKLSRSEAKDIEREAMEMIQQTMVLVTALQETLKKQ